MEQLQKDVKAEQALFMRMQTYVGSLNLRQTLAFCLPAALQQFQASCLPEESISEASDVLAESFSLASSSEFHAPESQTQPLFPSWKDVGPREGPCSLSPTSRKERTDPKLI